MIFVLLSRRLRRPIRRTCEQPWDRALSSAEDIPLTNSEHDCRRSLRQPSGTPQAADGSAPVSRTRVRVSVRSRTVRPLAAARLPGKLLDRDRLAFGAGHPWRARRHAGERDAADQRAFARAAGAAASTASSTARAASIVLLFLVVSLRDAGQCRSLPARRRVEQRHEVFELHRARTLLAVR